jgi:transposase
MNQPRSSWGAFISHIDEKRIPLERLPGYAPELNPQEGVGNLLTRRELKNVCCRDLSHVATVLRLTKERLRHRRTTLRQYFAHAGCPV